MPDVSNGYQLIAFLIIAGIQIYTQRSVNKLEIQQNKLGVEVETTRVEMFRLLKASNGHADGFVATIEAALKVAYLLGKVDGTKPDAPYPQERIASAARQLADHAARSQSPALPVSPAADPRYQEPGATIPS